MTDISTKDNCLLPTANNNKTTHPQNMTIDTRDVGSK